MEIPENRPQELALWLAPLVDCVGFVELVEVGVLVEVLVEVAPVPLFKVAKPTVPFVRSWSM
jgi:hypothetical protein